MSTLLRINYHHHLLPINSQENQNVKYRPDKKNENIHQICLGSNLRSIHVRRFQGCQIKSAKQYDCDRRTVKRYLNARDETPTSRIRREVKKVTDGFESIIEDKFINCNAPAIAVYNLLVKKYNFKGSYATIKNFTHKLKEDKINEVTIRYETSPGLQCQVDWKE